MLGSIGTFWDIDIKALKGFPQPEMEMVILDSMIQLLSDGRWTSDIWSSENARSWRIETSIPSWKGRNSILAVLHKSRIFLMGSVQHQFYNTFSSTDGIEWEQLPDSCALTAVDVQQLVSYRGRLLAFTLGCHDRSALDEFAIQCDEGLAGPLQNRLYFSSDGRMWALALSRFEINQFLRAFPVHVSWSGSFLGEHRFDYAVVVHLDTLLVIAGKIRKAPTDSTGNLFRSPDGTVFLQTVFVKDIWASKGLFPATKLCNDRSDAGLQPSEVSEIRGAAFTSRTCSFEWTMSTVSRLHLHFYSSA